MKISMRNGIILLAGLGLIFCCAYMCGLQIILCQTPVPDEFVLSSDISSFAGTGDYTIADLVITSAEKVKEQVSVLDEAESEFVSAFYTCQNSDCTLFEVNIRVLVERRMNCMFAESASDPFASTVTNLSFDIVNDELSAETLVRQYESRNILSWEDLPLSIDEIIQIAFEAEGAQYAREHPEFELTVILLRDRWTLAFRSAATTVPDISLHIDSDGNILAD